MPRPADSPFVLGSPLRGSLNTNFNALRTYVDEVAAGAGSGGSATGADASYVIAPTAQSGSALQTAINALGTNGGAIRLAKGRHTWDVVPQLPPNMAGWLDIFGSGFGTTIALTASAPRVMDPGATTADQMFRKLRLGGFQIDASAVTGRHHLLFGNYINGSQGTRRNYEDIELHDVWTYGATSDVTMVNHMGNIWMSGFSTGSSDTLTTIKRIRVRNVHQLGGNFSQLIIGSSTGAVNCFLDDLVIQNVSHDAGIAPDRFYATTNFHYGGKGWGGRIRIRDMVGIGSGDDGLELNSWADAVVENVVLADSWNDCFVAGNFHGVIDVARSKTHYVNCVAGLQRLNPQAGTGGPARGFYTFAPNTGPFPMGAVIYEKCETYWDFQQTIPEGVGFMIASPARTVRFDACRVVLDNISDAPASASGKCLVHIVPVAGDNFTLQNGMDVEGTVDLYARVAGNANMSLRGIEVGGASTEPVNLDLKALVDMQTTGQGSSNTQLIGALIGQTAGSKVGGRLALSMRRLSGPTAPTGVYVQNTATLTIQPNRLKLMLDARGRVGGANVVYPATSNAGSVDEVAY